MSRRKQRCLRRTRSNTFNRASVQRQAQKAEAPADTK
uniref:Uncharacterized protein n=1 Tax=Anguilla anguilla TaxID=7936 RepID=A0A0E9T701_ANGAN